MLVLILGLVLVLGLVPVSAFTQCTPSLEIPEPGAVLDNGCSVSHDPQTWRFSWAACPEATAYHLIVKNRDASIPVIDEAAISGTTYESETFGYSGDDFLFGWFWRVRARIGGDWGPWSPEREFELEPLNTDCQVTQPDAVVALHVRSQVTKSVNICGSGPDPQDPNTGLVPCRNYSVQGDLRVPHTVYLVVARASSGPGIARLSCGIEYDGASGSGLGVYGWTLCADSDFPSNGWPASGGGNQILWDPVSNCQRTVVGSDNVHAVAGAFYVYAYSDGVLALTPNYGLPLPAIEVTDCQDEATRLSPLYAAGYAGFGERIGWCPCFAIPVATKKTTWGSLKSKYD